MNDVPTGCVGKLFTKAQSKNEHNGQQKARLVNNVTLRVEITTKICDIRTLISTKTRPQFETSCLMLAKMQLLSSNTVLMQFSVYQVPMKFVSIQ